MRSYRALREQYRPATLEVLFVGESPPPAPTTGARRFFYSGSLSAEHDHLYGAIMDALYANCPDVHPSDKVAALGRFRDDRFWLVDVLDFPIASIPPGCRDSLLDVAALEIAAWLIDLQPRHGAIICLKKLYERMHGLLEGTPARVLHNRSLPFPHPEAGESRRQEFMNGVRQAIVSTGAWRPDACCWDPLLRSG